MRTVFVLIAGMLAGSAATAALLQSPDGLADVATQDAVRRVKTGIVAGHRNRDRSALSQLYADDYTAFSASGGVRTKAELLDALPSDPEMVEGRYDLSRIRRWGTLAVGAGHGRMLYRNADGSTRMLEYDSVNVFEQRGGRWWYVAAFLP